MILKGSVSLIIEGKGVVCTLHEGDEFGKLGVVNEAVRYVYTILIGCVRNRCIMCASDQT